MTPEQPDDPVQRLWRGQQAEGGPMPMEAIKRRATAFQRKWRTAQVIEYGAGVYVIGFSTVGAFRAERPLAAAGLGMLAAAAVFVLVHMHRHGWMGRAPADDAAAVDFYRGELVRRRDLLRSVWKWYLLPFAPGFLTVLAARVTETPLEVLATISGALVLAGVLTWCNLQAAQRLQRELDALPF
jgi:hypothetical protein